MKFEEFVNKRIGDSANLLADSKMQPLSEKIDDLTVEKVAL